MRLRAPVGPMKRRDFILSTATLALLTGCGLLPNLGQPTSPRVARVGILVSQAINTVNGPILDGVQQGLAELRFADGQTIDVEERDAGGDTERLPDLVNELLNLPVAVLVAFPSPAVLIAKRATTTVPIVFANASDPVGKGFVASLDHPGGNVTGISAAPPTQFQKLMEYLVQVQPGLSRVAFFTSLDPISGAGGASGPSFVQVTTTAANALGIQLKFLDVGSADDVDSALAEALAWHVEAMIMTGIPFADPTPRLIDFQLRNRVPVAFGARGGAQAGGLLGYGTNLNAIGHASAVLVDKILKGAKPADLPVEQPTEYELVVNQTTAQALGISIPPEFARQVTQWVQ